jgi:hypothetical protein
MSGVKAASSSFVVASVMVAVDMTHETPKLCMQIMSSSLMEDGGDREMLRGMWCSSSCKMCSRRAQMGYGDRSESFHP